ncbi:type I polyketide synthase [Streptomyces sp. B1866]|uniref:type I polyketide synthase n=1 Tax=Streptomyces sp. B1866 TaxID=3075431 RepID=UPI0028925E2F|nr:type I polyketide synthase [Streptomyces sp. B1866]MDT3395987.1 type I polyketide synthase [Streptomyces sp. B1866]
MTTPHDTPTPAAALKSAFRTIERLQGRLDAQERAAAEPIAVIGLGCRFPGGAVDADSYWQLLADGVDAVREVPPDRWNAEEFFSAEPAPGKLATKRGGFLDRVDQFDHAFFGISRREAVFMDPQQRLTLEVAWQAVEHAGLAPSALAGSRTGVYLGVCSSDFAMETLRHPLDFSAYASTGSAHSVVAGRLSYTLDLRGPSVAVDTACSSSLVAVQQACAGLRAGECDLALSGGVNVILSPLPSISFSQFGRMVSPDGRCKAFDASADGYVRGEGCGVVVLKRLSDAVRDGDQVMAVVLGGAVNQDGRSAGVTAPNGSAQRDVLRRAVAAARIRPEEVSFVEAHGTGTRLGDPIEVEALAEVYGRPEGAPVYLGAGKTNIGHPEAAAGIAGLIKAVLALHRGTIPGNVHFRELNPDISFDGTTFAVPTAPTPWPDTGHPRTAAVSAFGFSGTNAHVVLREAPPRPAAEPDERRPASVLALSARTGAALTELARAYGDRLTRGGEPLADLCHAANTGRARFDHRLAVTGRTRQEVAGRLAAWAAGDPDGAGTAAGEGPGGETVFVFAGQGVQRVGMARGLYETQPAFRAALERCEEILRPDLERPLLSVLYPQHPGSPEAAARLEETGYAQPAVFAVEYALAELWRSWGVEPAAVLGHSFGEYVAACVAGVMSLEDGLALTVARSRLMATLSGHGAMAAIAAPELVVAEEIADHPEAVSIAAVNGPVATTVSGDRKLVAEVCAAFAARGVRVKQLAITTASHSPLVEPILKPLREAAAAIRFQPPRIPLVSNLDGRALAWDAAPDADYWCEHARRPVRFAAGVATLLDLGARHFVETGPAPVLLGLVDAVVPPERGAVLLPSLRPRQDDWQVVTDSVARLYAAGGEIDWRGWDRDYRRTRVAVPATPFEKTVCWREPRQPGSAAAGGGVEPLPDGGAAEGGPADEELLYRLDWRPAPPAGDRTSGDRTAGDRTGGEAPGGWLLFADASGVADALAGRLRERGRRCVLVTPGPEYRPRDAEGRAAVRPGHPGDLRDLLAGLDLADSEELTAVHLSSLDWRDPGQAQGGCLEVARAVGALAGAGRAARLWLVTRGAVPAGPPGPRPVAAPAAALWGLGRSLQQEHAALWGGLVDLDPGQAPAELAEGLLREVAHRRGEDQVALRGSRAYVPRLVAAAGDAAPRRTAGLRRDAAYLVTGGLSGVGLAIARSLAGAGARRLVLVGRTPLPARAAWAGLPGDHPATARVAAVRALEALGAEVHAEAFDVADEAALAGFLDRWDGEGRPPLRGVVHAAGEGAVIPLAELGREDLERQWRGKALGAWALHRHLARRPLDFFVLCSSTSSVLSSPSFGAYAAANAYLDALAHQRRDAGLPGLSVNWGIWRDTGMAARAPGAGPGLSRGMGTLEPDQAVRVFHQLLRSDAAQLAAVPVDWSDWGRRYRDASGSALLDELIGAPAAGPAEPAARAGRSFLTREELFGRPPEARPALLADRLLETLAATLEDRDARPGPDQPLVDLGVDSLMAVELKNGIDSGLGVTLPVGAFLDGACVRDLAGLILDRLAQEEDGAGGGIERVARVGRTGLPADVAAELLAELRGLSGHEAGTAVESEGRA